MSHSLTQLDPTLRSLESLAFEIALRNKVVGQEEAVRALVDVLHVYFAEMRAIGRPVGNHFFLGPTGSGKTRIVEAAAEILFGEWNCRAGQNNVIIRTDGTVAPCFPMYASTFDWETSINRSSISRNFPQ
jgi:hypothetical protein